MQLSPDILGLALVWYPIFLFSTTLHEAAHAWAALVGGDSTAYEGGQVTLDPTPHIQRHPFGMVVVPFLTFALSGFMIGFASAPYNIHWALRHPKRAGWMSLAGPSANLLLVIVSGVAIHIGIWLEAFAVPSSIGLTSVVLPVDDSSDIQGLLATAVSIAFNLNLLLFVFNLLPVPPLDGSGCIPLFLNDEQGRRFTLALANNRQYQYMGLFIAWYIFGPVYDPVHTLALNMLFPGSGFR